MYEIKLQVITVFLDGMTGKGRRPLGILLYSTGLQYAFCSSWYQPGGFNQDAQYSKDFEN